MNISDAIQLFRLEKSDVISMSFKDVEKASLVSFVTKNKNDPDKNSHDLKLNTEQSFKSTLKTLNTNKETLTKNKHDKEQVKKHDDQKVITSKKEQTEDSKKDEQQTEVNPHHTHEVAKKKVATKGSAEQETDQSKKEKIVFSQTLETLTPILSNPLGLTDKTSDSCESNQQLQVNIQIKEQTNLQTQQPTQSQEVFSSNTITDPFSSSSIKENVFVKKEIEKESQKQNTIEIPKAVMESVERYQSATISLKTPLIQETEETPTEASKDAVTKDNDNHFGMQNAIESQKSTRGKDTLTEVQVTQKQHSQHSHQREVFSQNLQELPKDDQNPSFIKQPEVFVEKTSFKDAESQNSPILIETTFDRTNATSLSDEDYTSQSDISVDSRSSFGVDKIVLNTKAETIEKETLSKNILDQVQQQLDLPKNEKSSRITIILNPENLGTITIAIDKEKNTFEFKFDKIQTFQAMENQRQEISAILESHGFSGDQNSLKFSLQHQNTPFSKHSHESFVEHQSHFIIENNTTTAQPISSYADLSPKDRRVWILT